MFRVHGVVDPVVMGQMRKEVTADVIWSSADYNCDGGKLMCL